MMTCPRPACHQRDPPQRRLREKLEDDLARNQDDIAILEEMVDERLELR